MKALVIFGSVIGFVVAAGFGMANGSSWPNILWHASAAALATAFLTRWWGLVWFTGLRDAVEQRRRANHLNSTETKPTAKL